MHLNCFNERKEELVREIQELENAYVEAFADEADKTSLSWLWDRIKKVRREADETERSVGRRES
jgi:hypothetical protein